MSESDGGAGVLSRTSILALYSSPLVPNKLDGMKELSEWYGDYTTPPSPPIQRSQLSSSRANSNSTAPQSTSSSSGGNNRRLTPFNSDSNPFANFGRFGVDGGLIGEPLEMPRRRGGKMNNNFEGGGGGGGGDSSLGAAGKDLAPHLRKGGVRDDAVPPWASENSKRDQFLKEERNNRSMRNGANGNGELEPRRRRTENGDVALNGKDRRGLGPADEGGWRSVGTTREEREKRLLRNQATGNSTDSPRRFDRDRRDNDRGGEREPYARGGRGGPAWMNDEDSSSSPSWVDAPANGNLKFSKDGVALEGGGGADSRDDDELLDVATPTKKTTDWQASSAAGGMDSIQQWKLQMKEMERKEQERDLRDAGIEPQHQHERRQDSTGESVFSALTSPKPEPASTKSIFEDLGIVRSPAVAPAAPPGLNVAQGQISGAGGEAAAGGGGGRGSRFAKFFDGKPQSPVTQAQQPPPSVFGALMGGASSSTNATSNATTGTGPSKEDADSMARLLGMLQVQGTRTGSPLTTTQQSSKEPTPSSVNSPSVASQTASPLPPSALASTASGTEESRSSSRFKFSNSSARTSSPSVGTRSVPPSQPASAIHSPTSTNQTAPPPSHAPSSSGFAGYNAQQSYPSLNHLPPSSNPSSAAGDRMRSPPLPVPNSHHPRTISSTSDLGARPLPNHQSSSSSSAAAPLPVPNHPMNQHHAQQPHHQQGHPPSYPPQFFQQAQANGQRIVAQGGPLSPSHGMPLPHMTMFSPGPGGNGPPLSAPHPQMMNPEMLRNLAASNGLRSPPLPGHQQPYPGMMAPPPPPPGMYAAVPPPHLNALPHQFQQGPGGRPGGAVVGMQGISMGGNAGADLMALLNSGGNGGMRIGGQAPPNRQQPGNLPPFLMEGR
ncbi:uncharacterized protein JCM6883_001761 [Sporobolomyces salmoneus]|uniref:uncharacterized protein n=1 Tax=Sporobolomyces salmoneus TaxID=183962 RepID=UPI00316FFBF4